MSNTTAEPKYVRPSSLLTEARFGALRDKWKALDLPSLELSPAVEAGLLLMLDNSMRPVHHQRLEAPGGGPLSERDAELLKLEKFVAPILVRVYPKLLAHVIASVQPMTEPVGAGFHRGAAYPVVAHSHTLRLVSAPKTFDDLRAFHGLDAEVEMVAAMAHELRLELDRDLIRTVTEKATLRVVPSREHLAHAIAQALQDVCALRAKEPQDASYFVVTSPEGVAALSDDPRVELFSDAENSTLGIEQSAWLTLGTLRVAVYEDPFFPRDRMLVGWRNGVFDAGVNWHPYVLAAPRVEAPAETVGLYTRGYTQVREPGFFTLLDVASHIEKGV